MIESELKPDPIQQTFTQMYTDISKIGSPFPKTLMIRNYKSGMIWQVYHVNNKEEADQLASDAYMNGFWGSTLEDYQPDQKENWPGWRDTPDCIK